MMKLMMKKGLWSLLVVLIFSCSGDDDGPEAIPERDRGEESLAAQQEIEEFLQTHFYNYEEFQDPPADFDYVIRVDSLVGDNVGKTPLIDQVSFKMVPDRREPDVMYKLYYLSVIEGSGDQVKFPDITTLSFEGRLVDGLEMFDSSEIPLQLDLTQTINGFQDGLVEFKTAESLTSNPDGSVSFEKFGVGAVFVPSGLGYFAQPPPPDISAIFIPVYAQLMFTFRVYAREDGDQDQDGVPSLMEDLNGNGIEEDDDTDGDGVFNVFDGDDDNDGRPTRDEIEIAPDGTITFPDVDGDGTPDYLDEDS